MERRKWPMSTRVTNGSGLLFELLWPNDRLSWYKERLVLEAAAYNVLALHKGVLEKSTKTALNKNSLPCIHEPKKRNTEILIPKIQFSLVFPYAKKGTKNVSFPQRFPMPRLGWNPREIPKHPVVTHAWARGFRVIITKKKPHLGGIPGPLTVEFVKVLFIGGPDHKNEQIFSFHWHRGWGIPSM